MYPYPKYVRPYPKYVYPYPKYVYLFPKYVYPYPKYVTTFNKACTGVQAVPRSNLQLISVACMLVASKHEEERHPSVQDFTSIADNCFLAGDLLKMESLVLQSLEFRINAPTSCTFLSMFQQGINLSPKAHAMAAYFTVCWFLTDPFPQLWLLGSVLEGNAS